VPLRAVREEGIALKRCAELTHSVSYDWKYFARMFAAETRPHVRASDGKLRLQEQAGFLASESNGRGTKAGLLTQLRYQCFHDANVLQQVLRQSVPLLQVGRGIVREPDFPLRILPD